MGSDDLSYWTLRADQERRQADAATSPQVAAIHHWLCAAYQQRMEARRDTPSPAAPAAASSI